MVLPIFPAQALDSSVITTVWVGLAVITFLNLRFGTTLAGLVVPGYLVPLLLVKPASAFVIWGEAIVTYLLARLIADRMMRWTGSCTMFGRDRFFALLLVSVFVRTVSDGWLLPGLGRWLAEQGHAFDYHNNLYSFGLVIIALTANQMWNSGLARGMGVFVLYVALTYAIVRGLLIPYTNFDIAGLGFLYEGIATDILASPKAYLILLATAFIASRMNLHYGWEFSGILVPALLALQWFQPTKLLISLFEAALIFGLGRLALRLPMFRRMNMEGSRLLLLFFTVGYVYKIALGFVLMHAAPDVKASDYFAFGYLLSTLLAVKMHQKQLTWQISRTTLQTSLMGLAAASAIGYLLVVALPAGSAATAPAAGTRSSGAALDTDSLTEALVARKRAFYESEGDRSALMYSTSELQGFSEGIAALLRYRDSGRPGALENARAALARGGFVLENVQGWWLVQDRAPSRGSGLFAINSRPRTPLTVQVPAPLDEPGVFEAAALLAQADGHAAFASAGTRRERLQGSRSNVLRNAALPFSLFNALTSDGGVLQVRGLQSGPLSDAPAELWIQRQLPPGLGLDALAARVGPVETHFGRRPAPNRLRDITTAPFAELLLSRPARLRLIARTLTPARALNIEAQQRVDGYLYASLIERRDAISSAGSERFVPPRLGDLLYFQAEVLEPLFQVAANWHVTRNEDALRAIDAAASTLGYRLVLHRHVQTGVEHAILLESPDSDRHWGTYVMRMGPASPYLIEIPRPLAERQTFEYGTRLFARMDARALLISGAHPAVREDGRGDVLERTNPRTVFNLAHQVLVTALGEDAWVLQVRGRRDRTIGPAPDVIADFVGRPAGAANRERLEGVLEALGGDADTVALAATGPNARARDASADAQSDFVRELPGPRFMTLWVSAQARRGYRDALQDDGERTRFAALGIPTEAVDLSTRLAQARFGAPPTADVRSAVDAYVRTRNVVALASVASRGVDLRRLVDLDSGRDYLELRSSDGALIAVRSLEQSAPAGTSRTAGDGASREAYLAEGAAWLVGRRG
ncbi:poly-gamma-glutamate biosynthesis protein PgsC/CapC [Lysobacter korlensis]|uniref:Poly-gamma-glutamate biosynthesis protein PgsC/CapC n=1 Tax=Lysobacter korlensis TaxID=553636 RepID=A0ABV6RLU8_9GAMM